VRVQGMKLHGKDLGWTRDRCSHFKDRNRKKPSEPWNTSINPRLGHHPEPSGDCPGRPDAAAPEGGADVDRRNRRTEQRDRPTGPSAERCGGLKVQDQSKFGFRAAGSPHRHRWRFPKLGSVGVLKLCCTIAGDRTARWARQFHAPRQGPSPASMPNDRRRTCARRTTPRLPRCCSFCAQQ
jgi:hypothetical protein